MVEMIYISILFENVITKFIPLFSFWDECLALLSILILFLNIIYKQRIKMDFLGKAGFYLILVIIIGIISTCVNYNLQDSKIAKFKDLLAIAKLYVIFSASYKIFLKLKTQQIIKRCARVTRYIVAIIFVCLILDYTFGIGMNRGVRYGIPLFIFLFTHATYAVAAYIFMMGILIADSIERNKWYIILCALFVILTMRAKGIVTVVIGLVLLFNKKYKFINWSQNKSGMLSLKKRYILLAVLLSIFAFRDKIIDYLSWGIKAARTGLYLIGGKILIDYFPLGAGFGTFASYISGEYYSNVYSLYNIENVSGMTKDNYSYISDIFWPYIYGQFGVFGFIAYTLMMFMLIKFSFKNIDINDDATYSIVLIWIYAIVASMAEAFFTNSSVAQFAIIIPLLIKYSIDEKKRN